MSAVWKGRRNGRKKVQGSHPVRPAKETVGAQARRTGEETRSGGPQPNHQRIATGKPKGPEPGSREAHVSKSKQVEEPIRLLFSPATSEELNEIDFQKLVVETAAVSMHGRETRRRTDQI
ncbi:hypothetical protein HPB48_007805 [Haemaphysalis longicornis]|uniref:Uncharacterized protein n=1 Tax=Haemaphysalis longicornis TaxID=44386 RepID=A0A9J6FX51_HAELO|nr:hypothetical protein HPB48_007805 [Haemaphysalis longicornis]